MSKSLQQNWEEYRADAFPEPLDVETELFYKGIFFDGALAAADMTTHAAEGGLEAIGAVQLSIIAANQTLSDAAEAVNIYNPSDPTENNF